jgi:hypothetical protein
MTAEGFFDGVRRGLYALLSLVAGGLAAGAAMLMVCLLGGLGGLFVGLAALVIWPVGMLVVGGPVWAILHLLGRRGVGDARIAGGVGGALSVLLIAVMLFGPGSEFWLVAALAAAGLVSGVVGGSVVWSLAYGGRHGARA